jgi:hypothetical protein
MTHPSIAKARALLDKPFEPTHQHVEDDVPLHRTRAPEVVYKRYEMSSPQPQPQAARGVMDAETSRGWNAWASDVADQHIQRSMEGPLGDGIMMLSASSWMSKATNCASRSKAAVAKLRVSALS